MVWLASDEVYTERVLRDYALLGDNIVIADERVATVYRRVMGELGVKISLSKFLISKSSAMEFAKGFFVGTRDFFLPISVKIVRASRIPGSDEKIWLQQF